MALLHCAKRQPAKPKPATIPSKLASPPNTSALLGKRFFRGNISRIKICKPADLFLNFFLWICSIHWRCGPLLRFRGFERASACTGRLLALSLADLSLHSYIVVMYLHSTVPVLRIKVFKRCDQFHHWCHGEMALSSLGTFWRLQLFNAANLSSLGKGWAESLKCLASVSQAVASNCNSPVVFVPGNALEPCFFHLHAVTRAATSCPDCLDVVCCQYAFKKIIIKAEDGPQWAWGGNYRHYFVYYRKKKF